MAVSAVIVSGPNSILDAAGMACRAARRVAKGIERRYQQQSVHDRHSQNRDEAHGGRDVEIESRKPQDPDAAHRHDDDVCHDHDASMSEWNARYSMTMIKASARPTMIAMRCSASCICWNSPLHTADRALKQAGGLGLGLGDGAGQVATANAELDRDQTIALLAEMIAAPGRTKVPCGSGTPCSSTGVTRSFKRRRGTRLTAAAGGAVGTARDAGARACWCRTADSVALPANRLAGGMLFFTTSTGMSRIALRFAVARSANAG